MSASDWFEREVHRSGARSSHRPAASAESAPIDPERGHDSDGIGQLQRHHLDFRLQHGLLLAVTPRRFGGSEPFATRRHWHRVREVRGLRLGLVCRQHESGFGVIDRRAEGHLQHIAVAVDEWPPDAPFVPPSASPAANDNGGAGRFGTSRIASPESSPRWPSPLRRRGHRPALVLPAPRQCGRGGQ